jgi:hypothetical protein
VLGAPAAARAQGSDPPRGYRETSTLSGHEVVFDEDLTSGSAVQPLGDPIRSGIHVLRAVLVRPRLNFVPEMLKSVESM